VIKIFYHLLTFILFLGLLALTAKGLYWIMTSETYQIAGEIYPSVQTAEKVVALTFDDGPTQLAPEIVKILKDKGVTATFYLIGENIEKFNKEARMIVKAGHEIGNHSYSHQRMILKSPLFIDSEINTTNQLIRAIGYEGDITFRPPFGKKLFILPAFLEKQGIKTITWDVEPTKNLGASASAEAITKYVVNHAKPGSIILIHPWYGEKNNSRAAIPAIINELKSDGFRFVSVSELLKLHQPKPKPDVKSLPPKIKNFFNSLN